MSCLGTYAKRHAGANPHLGIAAVCATRLFRPPTARGDTPAVQVLHRFDLACNSPIAGLKPGATSGSSVRCSARLQA